MTKLKLSILPDDKPVKLTVELPAAIHPRAPSTVQRCTSAIVQFIWSHLLSLRTTGVRQTVRILPVVCFRGASAAVSRPMGGPDKSLKSWRAREDFELLTFAFGGPSNGLPGAFPRSTEIDRKYLKYLTLHVFSGLYFLGRWLQFSGNYQDRATPPCYPGRITYECSEPSGDLSGARARQVSVAGSYSKTSVPAASCVDLRNPPNV